jgi:NAD+ kinase
MNLDNVLVFHKRSAYEIYCEQDRDPRILRLLAENHFTIQDLRKGHTEHRETLEKLGAALESLNIQATFVRRAEMRDVGHHDMVITVGGDGTFLEASHLVRDTPMLGLNSAPSLSVGVFCAATSKTIAKVLAGIRKGTIKALQLNRMGVTLNGTVLQEPVLNELLVAAQNPATTARYFIELGRKREVQKSSGVFVGPAAGSTAVMRAAGGRVMPLTSKQIQYVVREPYRGPGRKLTLVRGLIAGSRKFRIYSKMRSGMIFIDGPHVRYRFGYGDVLEFTTQFLPLTVYGLLASRRRRS